MSYKVFFKSNYFIYTRLGIMVAINTKSNFTYNVYNADGSVGQYENDKFTYGTNLGLQGAAGIQYKLTNHVSLFGEFAGNFLTVKPKTQVNHQDSFNNDGSTDFYNYNITFFQSGSGTASRTISTVKNGNTTTTTFTDTAAPILEHINDLMLNVGLIFAIK